MAAIFVAISSLEGMLLKPWLIGRTARLNNVGVRQPALLGLGLGGMGSALAFPILMVLKIIADHTDALQPVSELLGT